MTAIHRFVEACRNGTHPSIVTKLQSGWVIMGEIQVVEGYCLLLPDPVVPHLNALDFDSRTQFLSDMARAGDAVLAATGADRINYEMLGNLEPALHAHILPRSNKESEELRTKPIWFYDWENAPRFSSGVHGELLQKIRAQIEKG